MTAPLTMSSAPKKQTFSKGIPCVFLYGLRLRLRHPSAAGRVLVAGMNLYFISMVNGLYSSADALDRYYVRIILLLTVTVESCIPGASQGTNVGCNSSASKMAIS
jgi:hypothetical protein